MKARLIHWYEVVAGAILSLLGFTSCRVQEYFEPKPEYGMPHANYQIVGSVKAEDTGEPIPNIQVKYRRYQYTDNNGVEQYWENEARSDENGNVSLSFTEFPVEDNRHQIVLTDTDGEDNGGLFRKTTLPASAFTTEYTEDKSGRWHVGDYAISFAAKLKRDYQESPAEYGMPHATYKVIGQVSSEDGTPIPGIEVLMTLYNQDDFMKGTTDNQGKVEIVLDAWPNETQASVEFKDVDGEANGGLFQSEKAIVTFQKEAEGQGHWYEGTFSAEVKVKLKKQE